MTGVEPLSPHGRDTRSRLVALVLLAAVLAVGFAWVAAAGGLPSLAPATPPGDPGGGGVTRATSSPHPVESGTVEQTPPASPSLRSPLQTTPVDSWSPSPSAPLPDPVFGMGGHLMWRATSTAIRQLDMLREDGLGVVRFDVSWRNSEPRRGEYDWLEKLDEIVDAAVARGIRPVIAIVETPAWANGGQSPWVPPDDPADYAAFAAMLAHRYAGRVDAWEVWNEPDIRLFWRPEPDSRRYAEMLIAAHAAIKAANPSATVVGGSVTFGNTGFVEDLYRHGAGDSFDALSVHPYTLRRAPDDEEDRFHSLTAILDDMRGLMVAQGDGDKPIWVTELGWAVVGLNSVSEERRIAYLRRSVQLIRQRPWVEVVAIYTISTQDSERYGLSTDGRRSAAWEAYVEEVRNGER
jgi:hypothetical protein